jgi:hypothetical protein
MPRQWASLMVVGSLVGGTCLGCSQAPAVTDASLSSTAVRLDEARRSIQPSLGATDYTFSRPFIDNVPLGENAPLSQVLRRAPDVRPSGW